MAAYDRSRLNRVQPARSDTTGVRFSHRVKDSALGCQSTGGRLRGGPPERYAIEHRWGVSRNLHITGPIDLARIAPSLHTQDVGETESRRLIPRRLEAVLERIAAAEARAGRSTGSVQLVAVSKRKPPEDIVAAYEAGQRDFGENYVQEFEAKRASLPLLPEARFHLIGRLQSNKAKRAADIFHTIQTVDSVKLANRLDRFGKPLDVFLEVKLSHEESKSGMDEANLDAVLQTVADASNLKLVGLMTMPPWHEDPELSRPYFRKLRALAESIGVGGLSMGMSRDLEVAIEEGATQVRVGTAIFGERPPK